MHKYQKRILKTLLLLIFALSCKTEVANEFLENQRDPFGDLILILKDATTDSQIASDSALIDVIILFFK